MADIIRHGLVVVTAWKLLGDLQDYKALEELIDDQVARALTHEKKISASLAHELSLCQRKLHEWQSTQKHS